MRVVVQDEFGEVGEVGSLDTMVIDRLERPAAFYAHDLGSIRQGCVKLPVLRSITGKSVQGSPKADGRNVVGADTKLSYRVGGPDHGAVVLALSGLTDDDLNHSTIAVFVPLPFMDDAAVGLTGFGGDSGGLE